MTSIETVGYCHRIAPRRPNADCPNRQSQNKYRKRAVQVRKERSADYVDFTDFFPHLRHPRNLRIKLPIRNVQQPTRVGSNFFPRRNNERTHVRCYVWNEERDRPGCRSRRRAENPSTYQFDQCCSGRDARTPCGLPPARERYTLPPNRPPKMILLIFLQHRFLRSGKSCKTIQFMVYSVKAARRFE